MEEFIGECEICGRGTRGLRVVVVTGLDTFACHECLGDDPDVELSCKAGLGGRRGSEAVDPQPNRGLETLND